MTLAKLLLGKICSCHFFHIHYIRLKWTSLRKLKSTLNPHRSTPCSDSFDFFLQTYIRTISPHSLNVQTCPEGPPNVCQSVFFRSFYWEVFTPDWGYVHHRAGFLPVFDFIVPSDVFQFIWLTSIYIARQNLLQVSLQGKCKLGDQSYKDMTTCRSKSQFLCFTWPSQ